MNLTKELIKNSGIEMPDVVKKHYSAALSDLYNGPLGVSHFREEDPDAPDYSFVKSCRIVSEWFHDQDWPSYCDEDGFPLDDMDRVNLEEEGIMYYAVDTKDIKHEIFGELASYL